MTNNVFQIMLKKYHATIEYGINWHVVRYPEDQKNNVKYLIDLFYNNPDYRFIENKGLQFHYKQW